MYSLPLQSSRWFSHKWVSNLTERIHSICTSLIMLAEEDNTSAKFGAGQNFYTVFPPPQALHFYRVPTSTTTTFPFSSLPPQPLYFYCLPTSTTTFPLSSLLHHHSISIVFPPPPPLHFYCFPPPPSLHFYCLPFSTMSTFLLSSLLHHHCISIVFPPPSPLHF